MHKSLVILRVNLARKLPITKSIDNLSGKLHAITNLGGTIDRQNGEKKIGRR